MLSAADIAGMLAGERRVETIAMRIAHSPMTDDLRDLCQMVYAIILGYDAAKLNDLFSRGQLDNFIARVIITQYRSKTSPYYNLIRKFRDKTAPLEEAERRTDD